MNKDTTYNLSILDLLKVSYTTMCSGWLKDDGAFYMNDI